MLLSTNGSSGESCTKRSDHSSDTSSPHSDPNQPFGTQAKSQLGYPPFQPPGKLNISKNINFIIFHFFLCLALNL